MSDEELVKRLRSWAKDIQEGSTAIYAMDLDLKNAASSIDALTAKLATCEKYRDAYAECDRIGTQAVRDLEAKLAKAVEALEDASQIIRQCTWTTMRVNGQYVDRREVVQSYRATLAEIEGDQT